ncbi:MAG: transporter related protein [Deferribacteraceae bacterium]|nr:transporter related protein [Deferribacteraceae bacterium]
MIEIKNITKHFDDKIILSKISFTIEKGSFTVINGPSGSGKSTLLSIISGLARPTSGEVLYNNINISKLPEKDAGIFRNEKIGFVFQKFNLVENLTVYENLLPPVIIANKKFDKHHIYDMLRQLEIDSLANTKISKLSGGEQQRVALARALINNPEIIIADEPTANLDYNLKMSILKFFEKINKSGKTLIVATHDDIFVRMKGVKVVLMENGLIKAIK